MITTFSLNDWMMIWMRRLQPTIEYAYDEYDLKTRYDTVMKFASYSPEYTAKLFGDVKITKSPTEYVVLRAVLDMNLTEVWNSLSLEEQAKWVTIYQIKNMLSILDRHAQLQKEEVRKAKNSG
jgi:hypothetical protein